MTAGIEWHHRIDTSKGLTPEQLSALVETIAAQVDPIPDDDFTGGLSGGAENALDAIIEIVGMVDGTKAETPPHPFGEG